MDPQQTADVIRSPEEIECDRQLAEIATLDIQVAHADADLTSLRSQLEEFEAEYLRVVAPCYAEMEEIQADAAAARALRPDDAEDAPSCPSAARESVCPTPELKTLFREVARNVHPDLAATEDERRRRGRVMAHANAAYSSGNHEQLRELLLTWKADPDAVQGDDIGAQLVRNIRRIAQLKNRIAQSRDELREVRKSDLYFLRQRAERARDEGRDFLAETRRNLEEQIRQQRARVAEMAH